MISLNYRLCSFPLDQYKIAVSWLLNKLKKGSWGRKQGREEGKDACACVSRYAYLGCKRQGMFAYIHTKNCITYISYTRK